MRLTAEWGRYTPRQYAEAAAEALGADDALGADLLHEGAIRAELDGDLATGNLFRRYEAAVRSRIAAEGGEPFGDREEARRWLQTHSYL